MKTFLSLNKQKIIFILKATSIVCLLIICFILFIRYIYKEELPDTIGLIKIILIGAIGFPLFILLLATYEWAIKRKIRRKALTSPPFDKLEEIGFTNTYIGKQSKWYFTEETLAGSINSFTLIINVSKSNRRIIEFKTPVKRRILNKADLKRLDRLFQELGIKFEPDGFTKTYSLKNVVDLNIIKLKEDLESFTSLILKEGFESEEG